MAHGADFFRGVLLINAMDFCACNEAGGRVEASFACSPLPFFHPLRAVDTDLLADQLVLPYIADPGSFGCFQHAPFYGKVGSKSVE